MTCKKGKVVDFQRHQVTREQLLEQLYSEHGEALRSFLRGRMGAVEHEVEDIVQDVFVRLARVDDLYEKVSTENRNSRAFMFTMANHILIDQLRQKAVRCKYKESEMALAQNERMQATPEVIAEGRQQLEVIEEAIMNLPSLWREAFVLNRFKYMSYKEVARMMGVSSRTVEKYIARALGEMRKAAAKSAGEWS